MFAVVTGAVKYIESSRRAGTPDHMMTTIVADRVNNIITMLGKVTPTMDDCTNAITLIGEQPIFSGDQKTKLLAAFHTKL